MTRQVINDLTRAFQKHPFYWIGGIILILFFLQTAGSIIFNFLLTMGLITYLLNTAFNDWIRSSIYAFLIIVIISLIHFFTTRREGFDNNASTQSTSTMNETKADLDNVLKQLETLGNMSHTNGITESNKNSLAKDTVLTTTNDPTKKTEINGVPVVTINGKTQPVEEFNQWDDSEKANVYKGLGKKEVKRPAATAQRELFQLIDTVKQLQDTVEQLGPTLKEGKKIMDAFENIKL